MGGEALILKETIPFDDQGLWMGIDIVLRKDGHTPESARRFLSSLAKYREEWLFAENNREPRRGGQRRWRDE